MITAERLQRINGHKVSLAYGGGQWYALAICHCSGGELRPIQARHAAEYRVLELLRDEVLRVHGEIAMERAKWACEECGSVTGLSAHHRVFRSHQRDDRVENLMACCSPCHDRKHGRKS